MGLLDGIFNDPQTMGLLSAAAAMAERSGPSTRPTSFGQVMSSGLLGGLQGYQGVQDAQTQKAFRDMQMKRYGMAAEKDQMEMDQIRAAQEQQKRLTEAYQSFGAAPNISSVMAAPGRVGPTPERAELIQQQADLSSPYKRNLALAQHLESKGLYDQATKLYETAEKYKPKVKSWQEVRQGDQVLYAPYFEDGSAGAPVPMEVARKMEFRDMGGSVAGLDPYTGKQGFNQKKTQSPDSVASNAVQWANHNLSKQRLDLDRANQGQPQFVADLGGFVTKPNAQNPNGGFTPLGGANKPDKPLTELQGKATNFAARMQDASKIISQFDGKVSPAAVQAAGGVTPSWLPGGGVIDGITNYAIGKMEPEAQLYQQAKENWKTANLRLESGAVIGAEESAAEDKKWFPQPGDTPEKIKQKAEARAVAERGMSVQAGPGANKLDKIVNGDKQDPQKEVNLLPNLPPAHQHKGKKIRDTQTGKVMVSNGLQWKEQ